jgi:hypothetical protein
VGGRRRPADLAAPLTIDLDSTIVEVHGRAKQGAAFGYTKVRGYHPQLATCAQTGQVLMSRLRGGSAGAAAARVVPDRDVSRVRNAGATGQLTVRADSAFYSKKVLATAAKFDVRFSSPPGRTSASGPRSTRSDDAWQPIPYWLSTRRSPAPTSPRHLHRLRRDKRHARQVRWSSAGSGRPRLAAGAVHRLGLPRVRHRPDLPLAEVEADHRRHAIVEQTIAELKSAGLAHLPVRHVHGQRRLARPRRHGAQPRPRRRQLAGPTSNGRPQRRCAARSSPCPGRLVHSGRRRHLRLPAHWPWADAITTALDRIHAIPLRC